MPAGDLKHRLRFERRAETPDDGYGNREGNWQTQFEVWAGIKPLRGSETVIASRLAGIQPVIITVRMSSQTKQIAAHWRAVGRDGKVYNIKGEGADTEQRRRYLDVMADTGGPT